MVLWTFAKLGMGQNLNYYHIFWGESTSIHQLFIFGYHLGGVFPILQDRPDFVAPMAAHHAAALDRVWWLERCGATPGRPGQPPLLYIYILYTHIYIYTHIHVYIHIYACNVWKSMQLMLTLCCSCCCMRLLYCWHTKAQGLVDPRCCTYVHWHNWCCERVLVLNTAPQIDVVFKHHSVELSLLTCWTVTTLCCFYVGSANLHTLHC